jgi:hypothetical protein
MKEVIEMLITIIFGFVLVMNLPLLMAIISNCILERCVKTPAENTVTGNTPQQRVREYKCRVGGCKTVGRYYGMSQATCRRCGHRNRSGADFVSEWSEPDD